MESRSNSKAIIPADDAAQSPVSSKPSQFAFWKAVVDTALDTGQNLFFSDTSSMSPKHRKLLNYAKWGLLGWRTGNCILDRWRKSKATQEIEEEWSTIVFDHKDAIFCARQQVGKKAAAY